MITKIIITGFAGQGVLWLGKQIARRVLVNNPDLEVSFLAEYEAGVRSGHSRSQVIVSDQPINCPFVDQPDVEIELENGKFRCGCMREELETKGRLNEAALDELFDKIECKELLGIND
jgi:hypothetical protein